MIEPKRLRLESGEGQSLVLTVQANYDFIDVTPYLHLTQQEAADMVEMPSSTFAKRYREAVGSKKKWPQRDVQRIDEELAAHVNKYCARLLAEEPPAPADAEGAEEEGSGTKRKPGLQEKHERKRRRQEAIVDAVGRIRAEPNKFGVLDEDLEAIDALLKKRRELLRPVHIRVLSERSGNASGTKNK